LIAECKEISRRLAKLKDAQGEWYKRAELAVSRNREDLARAALVEKAKVAEVLKALEGDDAILSEKMQNLDADIHRLQTKLGEAKAKQTALAARAQTVAARLTVREQLYDGRVDGALGRFDQVEKKLDEMEGRVEAFDLGRGKSLAEEIADLEAESDVEKELASLKAGTSKQG